MPLLYLLIPAVTAYIFFIPDVVRKGAERLRSPLPHIVAVTNAVVCTLLSMIIFMDFAAPLSFSVLKLIALLLCSVGFMAVFTLARLFKAKDNALILLALSLLTSILLETTVFNYKFWQTHDYEAVDVTDSMTLSGFASTDKGDDIYAVTSTSTITLYDLGIEVDNICLDAVATDDGDDPVYLFASVSFTDKSNSSYVSTPKQTTYPDAITSKYLEIQPSGEVDDIRIVLTTNGGKYIRLNSVTLNTPTPFNFGLWRLLAVAAIILAAVILRPRSRVWTHMFSGKSGKQLAFTCVVIVLQMLLLVFLTTLNPVFANERGPSYHHRQYQQLAEAMLEGKLYLPDEPPAYLAEMDNPYDLSARRQLVSETGKSYYWDAAYFEGKYYVYFGVVPVLLTYLPFRALTGANLPNFVVVGLFLCLFTIGAFLLIGKIISRYFGDKRIPYAAYLLLSLIFVNASGAVFIAKRPDFYSIPIISALTFTVFGLYLWMSSIRDDGSVSAAKGALGSLCMALVAGCRPQLLLASAFIFVIYWDSVFKHRSLFSKKGLASTAALILPYVAVAAFIMWYNNARFGSPFDFGAYYNLTTNDMTGRGFRVERLGLAFFTYFLQPPEISAVFPFLNATSIDTAYLGTTITESMFGGILTTIPLLWMLFTVPLSYKKMKGKRILPFIILGVCLSVFIALFDAQGSGILARYVSDYAFLAILAAIFVVLFRYGDLHDPLSDNSLRLHSFLRFSLFASAAYCFMLIFAVYGTELYYYAPSVFTKTAEMVQFWG
ncbi:MAG: hypothetical protein IJY08_06825 [Clostridia bacterium]|nr:hypothetical protein [Clostridia bacterium]